MKRDCRQASIETKQFNHPFNGTLAGVVLGFISSFPAQIGAAILGLNFGLEDPWPILVIGGVIAGAVVGGLLGYRMQRLKREVSLAAALLVIVAGLGGSLMIGGLNRAGGTTFTCQRLEPALINCTLLEQRWWGWSTQRAELFEGVQTAQIELLSGDVGQLVVLVTRQGEKGLYGFDLDLADQLKRFIDSPQPTFTLEQNDWSAAIMALIVGSIPLLLGGVGAWGGWSISKPAAQKPEKSTPVQPFEIVIQTPEQLSLRIIPERQGVFLGIFLALLGLVALGGIIYAVLNSTGGSSRVQTGCIGSVAVIFIILGVGLIINHSQAETVTFDKAQKRVTITRPGWLGRQVNQLTFEEINEIKANGTNVWLMLAPDKIIQLRTGSSDPGVAKKMVRLIERFLKVLKIEPNSDDS